MSQGNFVHLHCHTHYSLLDGANRIPELVEQTKKLGMNAVAITDHGNLYGAIEFYRECKDKGINPVVGYEAYLAPASRFDKKAGRQGDAYSHLTLLAKNVTGFKNLVKLSSIAFLEGFYYNPRIDREVLEAHKEGLVCLSGCLAGEFNDWILKGKPEKSEELAAWFSKLFGKDFYIEIQNNGLDLQDQCTVEAVRIAEKMGFPLVATADAHYLCQQDAEAHDVLFCINTGKKRDPNKKSYPEGRMPNPYYVRSPQDMYQLFPKFPDAVKRSQEIADGVDIALDFKKRHFPVFIPPGGKTTEEFLREICADGVKLRYGDNPSKEVLARLEHELGIICRMGFASYFLIVWDFVRFALDNGIPCSARGSGCGAVVSYVLQLSHVDPLTYDLLFERFLDPNRSEAPDIDIDFCQERREMVIDYVKRKYGESSVAQIATFGTLAAKAALKDVGRVLDIPLDRVNFMCKQVPMKGAIALSLDDAMQQSPEFKREYDTDPAVKQWVDIAMKLEGTNRNSGTHAAGVVIANGPITDYVPVQVIKRKDEGNGERKALTTQWVMGDLEKVGMLKMDFLGLRTLTLLDHALRLIKKTRGEDIDVQKLPLDDAETYKMLQRGDAKGVFQFESEGIRELLKRMKPDNIRDIVASTALYRPGPLEGGMVDEYIDCKHGRKKPDYPHAIMEEVLSETYGVMVYQEQVMRMLNRLGGIELSSAYACIKAISKKKYDIIDARKIDFVKGSKERGLDNKRATEIFDLIVKFGGYGFNKCVVGETVILDAATGERTTVGELFESRKPFTIHSLNDEGKLVPRRVEDVVWNGVKPVYELRTVLGKKIRATANHPFRTLDGWTNLSELRVEDRIATANLNPINRQRVRGVGRTRPTPRWDWSTPSECGSNGVSPRMGWSSPSEGLAACGLPLATLAPEPGVRTFAFGSPDILWDRIASIDYVGEFDTYDLTVEIDHNFVADGIVVHNSHSAAYAHVSYHTAYLKRHYTPEFFAALLSSEIDDGNKRDMLVDHINDAKRLGVQVLAPDVNQGEADFAVLNNQIVFGLTAVKGVGRGAAQEIVRIREEGGRFKDLYDFCERIDPKTVTRAAVEKLIKAGALDSFANPFAHRAQLLVALPNALQSAESIQKDRRSGQMTIFDAFEEKPTSGPSEATPLPQVERWANLEQLKYEKEALDFYFSSHPLAEFDADLRRFATHEIGDLRNLEHGQEVRIGGMISQVKQRTTKRGDPFLVFMIEDFSGSVGCFMWSNDMARYKSFINDDAIFLFEGSVDYKDREDPQLQMKKVITLETAKKELTKGLILRLTLGDHAPDVIDGIGRVLKRAPGPCVVYMQIRDGAGRKAQFRLGDEFKVHPGQLKVDELEMMLGTGSIVFTGR